jgi:hypothetical protein
MTDPSKTNPKDIDSAISVADPAIDAVTPPGLMVKATRSVLRAMNSAATAAEVDQASGGSGHSKPK